MIKVKQECGMNSKFMKWSELSPLIKLIKSGKNRPKTLYLFLNTVPGVP